MFEVDELLRNSKGSIPLHRKGRQSVASVAIKSGFYSMVEVLLRHGLDPGGETLKEAVWRYRTEIVELLFKHGADVHSVSFEWVVLWNNIPTIELFIKRGADLVSGYPIAKGLIKATRPFLRIYKELLPLHPELRIQADVALLHFCKERSMRGVSLMLWAGANPHTPVPIKFGDAMELWESPACAAVWEGDISILKKLGIGPTTNDMSEFLNTACLCHNAAMVRFLIGQGANPNDIYCEETFLAQVLRSLRLELRRDRLKIGYDFEKAWNCFLALVELGAKWNQPPHDQLQDLRYVLGNFTCYQISKLVSVFKSHGFCSDETLAELLNTPTFQKLLYRRRQAIKRLVPGFNIPRLDPNRGAGDPLSREEAAAYLEVSISTLRRLRLKGVIDTGSRFYDCVYPFASLKAYRDKRKALNRKGRPVV
ncbi:MAG: ankyrin repeat protein [Pedosphaera sp.]|nr:ankyrin repeat protein [Pedosphaera sp.]